MNHKKYWIILAMVWAQFACGGGGGGVALTKSDLTASNIFNYSVAVVAMLTLPSN
jgi:hypothetical protein